MKRDRLVLFLFAFLIVGCLTGIVYSAVPQSTVQTNAGGITTYVGHYGNFTESVNSGEYFLDAVNKTDIFAYPQQDYSYLIWVDNSTGTPNYFAKNGTTGVLDFTGTDFSTVMQNSVDSVNANLGGTIVLNSGLFMVNSSINLDRSIQIIGNGNRFVDYGTLLKAEVGLSQSMLIIGANSFQNGHGYQLSDFGIDGDGQVGANALIEIDGHIHDSLFSNLLMIASDTTNTNVVEAVAGADCHNIHFLECWFETGLYGVLDNNGLREMRYEHCHFAQNSYGLVVRAARTIIHGTEFTHNENTGLWFLFGDTASVYDSLFYENSYGKPGVDSDIVFSNAADNVIVQGNRFIFGEQKYAIDIQSGTNNSIKNNFFEGSYAPILNDAGTNTVTRENDGLLEFGDIRNNAQEIEMYNGTTWRQIS